VKGKAILYADRITKSMERATAETDRRRQKQLAFNAIHQIEPKSIRKPVQDIMEGARPTPRGRRGTQRRESDLYQRMKPEEVLRRIEILEKRMYKHARDLEFEEAAKIRDEIDEARRQSFGFSKDLAG
jgi:excinuclease ABC subunit B